MHTTYEYWNCPLRLANICKYLDIEYTINSVLLRMLLEYGLLENNFQLKQNSKLFLTENIYLLTDFLWCFCFEYTLCSNVIADAVAIKGR